MKKNQKNIEKILKTILLILILIFLYITIRSTYSKYITQQETTYSSDIANWHIKLNNDDIKNKKDFSSDVQLTKVADANIDQNIIAPTSKGTFNVTLESTGTEVAYDYVFKFADDWDNPLITNTTSNTSTSETETSSGDENSTNTTSSSANILPDFKVVSCSYTINGDSTSYSVDVATDNSCSGTVTPGENLEDEKIIVFSFVVEWYDGTDNVLNNYNDVAVSKVSSDTYAKIPLTLTVTQSKTTTSSSTETNTTGE